MATRLTYYCTVDFPNDPPAMCVLTIPLSSLGLLTSERKEYARTIRNAHQSTNDTSAAIRRTLKPTPTPNKKPTSVLKTLIKERSHYQLVTRFSCLYHTDAFFRLSLSSNHVPFVMEDSSSLSATASLVPLMATHHFPSSLWLSHSINQQDPRDKAQMQAMQSKAPQFNM